MAKENFSQKHTNYLRIRDFWDTIIYKSVTLCRKNKKYKTANLWLHNEHPQMFCVNLCKSRTSICRRFNGLELQRLPSPWHAQLADRRWYWANRMMLCIQKSMTVLSKAKQTRGRKSGNCNNRCLILDLPSSEA